MLKHARAKPELESLSIDWPYRLSHFSSSYAKAVASAPLLQCSRMIEGKWAYYLVNWVFFHYIFCLLPCRNSIWMLFWGIIWFAFSIERRCRDIQISKWIRYHGLMIRWCFTRHARTRASWQQLNANLEEATGDTGKQEVKHLQSIRTNVLQVPSRSCLWSCNNLLHVCCDWHFHDEQYYNDVHQETDVNCRFWKFSTPTRTGCVEIASIQEIPYSCFWMAFATSWSYFVGCLRGDILFLWVPCFYATVPSNSDWPCLALTLGPKPYYWPNTKTVSFGGSPPIATRTGWMALALLPFVMWVTCYHSWISLWQLSGYCQEEQITSHYSLVFLTRSYRCTIDGLAGLCSYLHLFTRSHSSLCTYRKAIWWSSGEPRLHIGQALQLLYLKHGLT